MIHLRHSGWMERKIGQQWSRKMPEEKIPDLVRYDERLERTR